MLVKFFKKWKRDEEAATAIEFSILSIPYILMSLAVFEIAIMYASASLLEGATASAARMIRTGKLQKLAPANQEKTFRTAVCDYASALIKCSDLVTESRPMTSFNDYSTMGPTYDKDGNIVSQGFNPGTSNSRVLIRASYRYKMLTPLVGPLLVGPSNSRLFISTVVLQTEPYEF